MVFRAIALALAASACVAASAAVPTASDVQSALGDNCTSIGTVSNVDCQSLGPEEPTEAVCSYAVAKGPNVIKDKTYFAVDSKGWHLTDMPAYCPGQK